MDGDGNDNDLNWLGFLRRYIILIALFNSLWEILQMPLYTLWNNDSWLTIIYSIIHCTFGDILIALTAISLSLLLLAKANWPHQNFQIVAILTVLIGISYTLYSEWLNIYIHKSWAYNDLMPLLSLGPWQIGLSPLLQWLILPSIALWQSKKVIPCK